VAAGVQPTGLLPGERWAQVGGGGWRPVGQEGVPARMLPACSASTPFPPRPFLPLQEARKASWPNLGPRCLRRMVRRRVINPTRGSVFQLGEEQEAEQAQ
jgi:hypothetical protein